MLKRLLFGGPGGANRLADIGLFILRAWAGITLAVAHGYGKVFNRPEAMINFAREQGFPAPTVVGWTANITEFFFAILLAIGLLTRPSAFLIACMMGVAAFIRHAPDDWRTREPSLTFLAIAVLFLLAGPGRYSIDAFIARKKPAGWAATKEK